MKCLLYLYRSFSRKPGRHLTLAITIICALILSFSVCIFRDSVIYGQELSVLHKTKGETYHVAGAKEEYLQQFSSLPGLSARYENGYIYLHIVSPDQASDPLWESQYAEMVSDMVDYIGDPDLYVSSYAYYGADESNQLAAGQWLIILITTVSLTLLVSAISYCDHIHVFSSHIGDLRAMGASRRQVFVLFFTELCILLAISSVIAGAGASALMKLLFNRFFQVMNVQNLAWLVFHVDIRNILAITAAFLCVITPVLFVSLFKMNSKSIVHLMREDTEGNKIKHYRRKLRMGKSTVNTMLNLLLDRINTRYVGCLLISVPAAIAFIISINTVLANIAELQTKPEFELSLTQTSTTSNGSGFTDADLHLISEIDGVADVDISSVITQRIYIDGVLQPTEDTGMEHNQIRIALADEQKHKSVETRLRSIYDDQVYKVQNDYEVYEKNQRSIVGLLYMLLFLLVLMFLLVSIVLCAKLFDFILAQRTNIRSLYGIGASANALTRSYERQAKRMALSGILLSCVCAIALLYMLYQGDIYSPYIDVAVFGLNIGCVLLFILSYSCPVRFALKRVMGDISIESR